MIRSSLAAGAAHGFAFVSAGNGAGFQRRRADGATSAHTNGPAVAAPRWVRIVRLGTSVTAFTSADARTWTRIGADTIALGATAYVGLAVTSHNVGALSTAVLSQVVARPLAVPVPQRTVDIGSPVIPGTVAASSGTYTINAAGLDIWNTADQFTFTYQPVTGDVDVSVRVRSVTQAHAWSKSGVMIRESLAAGSRHAFALASAGGGYGFHRRIDPGGYTAGAAGVAGTPPVWVRLVRSGSRIESFRSADGVTWTSMGVDVVPMSEAVYVGIATTSHNTGATTQAVLDGFRLIPATQPANQPPTVSLTAPASGTTYMAPASVALSASAADTDGTVARVEFYQGTTLLATDTTAPYSHTWSSVPADTYSLTAVAYDNGGARVTSAARSITVTPPTSTTAPTAIAFQASADHATVTSYRLDVFASGANPSTATPVATSDLAKPTPDATGNITVNRATFFSSLAAGTYQATVSAISSGGSSRSAAVTFTR